MAEHVKIDDITPYISYTVGVTPQSDFPFPFAYFADSDLIVTRYTGGGDIISVTTLVLGTHYTVTGNGSTEGGFEGGTVTLIAAATSAIITIERLLPIERTTDFPSSGQFSIKALNSQFDKLVAICQQLKVGIDAAVQLITDWIGLISAIITTDVVTVNFPSRGAAVLASMSDATLYIRTAGYYAAGDKGAALYKKDTSLAAGGFLSADGKIWNIAEPILNYYQFGAKGDAVTNDAAAITAAHSLGREVHDPGGTYRCNSALAVAGPIQLIGAGVNHTIFEFYGAGAAAGFWVTITNVHHMSFMRNATIRNMNATFSLASRAITLDGSSLPIEFTDTTDPFYAQHHATKDFPDRVTKLFSFSDLMIYTSSAPVAWARGIDIISLGLGEITNCSVNGGIDGGGLLLGRAYVIRGFGIPVKVELTNATAANVEIGLFLPDYTEGIHCKNCDWAYATIGVYQGYSATDSVVAAPYCAVLDLHVTNCHINAVQMAGYLERAERSQITGGLHLVQNNTLFADRFGWVLKTACQSVRIEGVEFGALFARPTPTDGPSAIYCQGIQCQITNNTLSGMRTGIWCDTGSTEAFVGLNRIRNHNTGIKVTSGVTGAMVAYNDVSERLAGGVDYDIPTTTMFVAANSSLGLYWNVGKAPSFDLPGLQWRKGDGFAVAEDSAIPMHVNRTTNDGTLVGFYRDGVGIGSIDVAAGVVTYAAFMGSHPSSPHEEIRGEILIGTVVETVDEMSSLPVHVRNAEDDSKSITEYADNDRLPRFRVSDTVASPAVYGVFYGWRDGGAATITSLGVAHVRIQGGQTVARGDLLESAGDGTAQVQTGETANVITSSTIGKVAANVVATTYEDGSYLVPCTLCCG